MKLIHVFFLKLLVKAAQCETLNENFYRFFHVFLENNKIAH
jgi:hypothetical protein